MTDLRCPHCRKLLARARLVRGLEIVCPRCRRRWRFEADEAEEMPLTASQGKR